MLAEWSNPPLPLGVHPAWYSHERGNPESISEFPLAQKGHSSRHKAAWTAAYAGHIVPFHAAKMLHTILLLQTAKVLRMLLFSY